MKRIILILLASTALFACSNNTADSGDSFGRFGDSSFTAEGAIEAQELVGMLNAGDSIKTKVKGSVTAACQAKGCWMSMDLGEDNEMTVTFTDYGFFVPKNSAGHSAIISGIALMDTISIAEQKEYAKDAEKSQEEIDAITSTKVDYKFIADGVWFTE
ncbi:MAG: DUF4920 domain-containing protein [Bacteroidia bacterium]